MTNRIEQQIAERINKTARFANMFNRENEYTYRREEAQRHLEVLVEEAKEEPESKLWYVEAIARTETEIQLLKELEAERRKYDELRSQIASLMNVY